MVTVIIYRLYDATYNQKIPDQEIWLATVQELFKFMHIYRTCTYSVKPSRFLLKV